MRRQFVDGHRRWSIEMKGNGLDNRTAGGKPSNEDAEEQMLSEGRRLSVWALIGAAAFVIAMIALAVVVFSSGGPNPGASDAAGVSSSGGS
jgi:hypothetical protein